MPIVARVINAQVARNQSKVRYRSRLIPSFLLPRPFQLLTLCGLVALCAGNLMAAQVELARDEARRRQASQRAPSSAEEVLQRALDARGGKVAAARIRSIRGKGTADFAWGGRCDFESFAARPNQSRGVFDFEGGSRYEFACDGPTAWEIRPGTDPEMQSGAKLEEARDHAAWFAEYDDPRTYRSVAFAGQTLFEGTRCYELKLVTQSGREKTHYYNATNYLLAGAVDRVTVETNSFKRTIKFLEYRMFAGVWLATRFRVWTDEGECVVRL